MVRKLGLIVVLLSLMLVGSVGAQDDVPTVAIIRFGPLQPFEQSQKGTLDLLEAYGYVDGENINIIFGDAAFDFPTANQLVEDALDEGADYIVAITTPVAQAAVNATLDMDEPPVVLFNTVTSPYAAGIAEASCIKPAHVWGSQALAPFENIMPLLFELNPDIETVGYIYNNAEANSVANTEIIVALAEELGLNLVIETVVETADVGIAAEAAVDGGAEAFFIGTDSLVSDGLPAILQVAEEVGIPLVHADSGQVYQGATVGAGLNYYQEGVDTARVLIALIEGDIDVETTGIAKQDGIRIAINLDSANLQSVDIPQSLLDMADYVIEDEESTEAEPTLGEMSMEEREASDDAYVEALFCTAEQIEEQQAELDAAGED